MATILKQSTAVDVLIGPFVDLTDGATAETGETPTVKVSKNGQALAAKSDVTVPVSDADGYYNCELDATDTNTVGSLVLTVAATATALPIRHEYQVVEEAVYDLFYAASADGKPALFTTQMTESYAADGVAPTPEQCLFIIMQRLLDYDVSGTTGTIRELDGTTAAATLTYDSATNPTDVNRTG